MKKRKCQRPGCNKKGTVLIYRDTAEGRQELWVCQVDVQWTWGRLFGLFGDEVKK